MFKRVVALVATVCLTAGSAWASTNPKGLFEDAGTQWSDAAASGTQCGFDASGNLPGGAPGCFFKVPLSLIEPVSGTYYWNMIDDELNKDSKNLPIEVLVTTGEFGSPSSTTACNAIIQKMGDSACTAWLGSGHTTGIATKAPKAFGGNNQAVCSNTWDIYPGDATYKQALKDFYTNWKSHFSNANLVGASIIIAGEDGHSETLAISSPCPSGSTTNYASAWNTVAVGLGCASNSESCWATDLENAIEGDWDDQVATAGFNQKNIAQWIDANSFPSDQTAGAADTAIETAVYGYMTANPPSGGHEEIAYEAQQNTNHAANLLKPYVTASVPPISQNAGAFAALMNGPRHLCDADITWGLCVHDQDSTLTNMRQVQMFPADLNNDGESGALTSEIAGVGDGSITCAAGETYCNGL